MPWRDNPGWLQDQWQAFVLLAATTFAVTVGTLTRITDQLKNGERQRFWSRRLFIDALGVVFMVLVCAGVAEYYSFGTFTSVAMSVVLGRLGPPAIDRVVESVLNYWEPRK